MPKYFFILFLLFFSCHACSFGQSAERKKIDSAKAKAQQFSKKDTAYLNTCFYIADAFMDIDMYDSAQLWLNEISSRLPIKKPTHFNFYLSVNQTITYYYNGLKQIGLKEGERALTIAKELKDSIYLATAYNISAVFLMNSDSPTKSLAYFKEGIKYCRQPPYAPKYLVISKPHNLYGNLGELYLKLKMYDSAEASLLKSIQLASEIPSYRGIAAANNLLGLLYLQKGKAKEAITFQQLALQTGLKYNHIDIALIAYGALAVCYEKIKLTDSATYFINKGFVLIKEQLGINSFFKKDFLEDALLVAGKIGNKQLESAALEQKAGLYSLLMDNYDKQITLLVESSITNETRAATLEVEDSKKAQSLANTRFIIVLIILSSIILLFFVNRNYHKKQLKEVAIRNRISQDLHDDIGATLSSIQIYGELAHNVLDNTPGHSKEMLTKITGQTKDLMSRMGDVIWSMKPVEEDKNSFTARCKNYSNELLSPKNIACTFDVDEELSKKITSPITRKNMLLIIKEAMNNIAKYSGASEAVVSMVKESGLAVLSVRDNGNGFIISNAKNGNGLVNMQQRCKQMKGEYTIQSSAQMGTAIICKFPIATISHT